MTGEIIDMVERLQKLPLKCFVGPTAAKTLAMGPHMLDRGVPGYTPIPSLTDQHAAELNSRYNVTPAQLEAMQIGACFGWHVPDADPDQHRLENLV